MPDDLHIDWLRLIRSPGIGAATVGRLIQHLGHPTAILQAKRSQLAAIPSIHGPVLQAIEGFRRAVPAPPMIQELQRLHDLGGQMLMPGTPDYPASLTTLHDPPPALFAIGDCTLLHREWRITITGTRQATPRGLTFAAQLAREMSAIGMVTISGLSAGIDAAAHMSALEHQGATIAVLATGIDIVHPRPHRKLQQQIATHGCLISEAPLGLLPVPWAFPARARILAALAQGVVIVEAPEKSGSLLTAHMALDQGREVFAVPGAPNDPNTRGTHALLRQGACLLEGISDLLQALQWSPPSLPVMPSAAQTHDLPDQTAAILTLIHNGTSREDELARLSRMTVTTLARILLQLELSGLIQRLPGGSYTVRQI
ncbi:MAG: DNA-protecting protein DprA [Magnetococcales bacterium]|nr:DNA-protecting protein DprA [Magnetococcales bacterium]